MKSPFAARLILVCLPTLALALMGCATANVSANPVCDAGAAMQPVGFPAAAMLPAGAVIDSQSSGSPPEFASVNYQLIAHSASAIEAVQSFYRCALPARGFPIIDEEQGNVWLLRFSGPQVNDGSVVVRDGRTEGEVSIEIFLVEEER